MLGVIIVNFNDWDNLINCIESIVVTKPYKIYVVDNASQTNTYSNVLKKNSKIIFIESQINGGYSYGNNLGLNYALKDGCEYFLICNTDIVFNKDSIDNLILPLHNSDCDIVGPKVRLPSGEIQEGILGVRVTPVGKIMLIINSGTNGLLFRKYKARFNNSLIVESVQFQVYGVSGCCFAFNKKTLEEILPFDENIFLFNEEWLIAEKCFKRGHKVLINNESEVLHIHGSTTKRMRLSSYKFFVRSEFYVLQNIFPEYRIVNFFVLLLRMPKLLIIYLLERSRS